MARRRFRMTFPPDLVTRPILWQMGTDFPVVTNIRRADVRENEGWVVLELEGEDGEIQRAVQWAISLGVRVDPVSGDVIEG